MPNDELEGLQGSQKLRELIRGRSMSQMKNGLAFRKAPCVLVIWTDALFADSALTVAAALYGDCRVRFSLTKPDQPSETRLEGNAAFLPNKNTTLSALCYVPEGGTPMVFHNPFAARELPTGLLPGREYVVRDDGTVELLPVHPPQLTG
jgi:hypothetical protein